MTLDSLAKRPAIAPVSREAIQAALDRMIAAGLVCRKGKGTPGDPYRYWKPRCANG
jgi:predicted transcriptional regulator